MPKSADLPWPAPLCESVQESVYQQHMAENVDEQEKVGAFISLSCSHLSFHCSSSAVLGQLVLYAIGDKGVATGGISVYIPSQNQAK